MSVPQLQRLLDLRDDLGLLGRGQGVGREVGALSLEAHPFVEAGARGVG